MLLLLFEFISTYSTGAIIGIPKSKIYHLKRKSATLKFSTTCLPTATPSYRKELSTTHISIHTRRPTCQGEISASDFSHCFTGNFRFQDPGTREKNKMDSRVRTRFLRTSPKRSNNSVNGSSVSRKRQMTASTCLKNGRCSGM